MGSGMYPRGRFIASGLALAFGAGGIVATSSGVAAAVPPSHKSTNVQASAEIVVPGSETRVSFANERAFAQAGGRAIVEQSDFPGGLSVVTVKGPAGVLVRTAGGAGGHLKIGEVTDRSDGGKQDAGTAVEGGIPANATAESQRAYNPIVVAMAMGRTYKDALAEQGAILRPEELISESEARKALANPKKATYQMASAKGVTTRAIRQPVVEQGAARTAWAKGDIYGIKYYDYGPGGTVRREYHAASVVRWYGYTNGYWYYGVTSNITGKVADGPNSMDQLGYNTSWYSGNRRYSDKPASTSRSSCTTLNIGVQAGPVSIGNSGSFCPAKTDPWFTYSGLGFGALWDAGFLRWSRDWRQAHSTAAIQHTPGTSMTFVGHPLIGWQN